MAIKFDPDKYKRRAYRKKVVLAKFMKKVGKSKAPGILKVVAEVDKATWSEVACLDCANCCKKMTPTYTRKDVKRISAHLNMTYQQFYDKWLKTDSNNDIINKSTPCQFLQKDHKCSIYEIRPDDCAGFPHIIRKDFRYQATEKTYINNITHCPATLVFVEKLYDRINADL
ncbi:MAG TPA: YkgJ family cysteine cluster protein [Chitinophagales bacterium]|nr:YkgJ family cysteine cluster protein [Chitinophagales bacterium]